jgi:diadenylate cyclase
MVHAPMQNLFAILSDRLHFLPYIPDILDILVMGVFLYGILLWLKQRRSRAVVVGFALVASLYVCARAFGMYLTLSFFHAGLTAILVSLVVIFQDDLRRVFERFAHSQAFVRNEPTAPETTTIDLVVEGVLTLAENRTGALVVFEGREPWNRHTRGGIPLNGQISLPLLYSIFHPESPGHDGAVVVSRDRVKAFAVHLPLSANFTEIGQAGTRHTAALGLAERSDALILVVSEERGTISMAEAGKLEPSVSPDDLKGRLAHYHQRQLAVPSTAKRRGWLQNLPLKLVALTLASLLWLIVAYRVETIQRTFAVPIEYRNLPPELALDDPRPTEAQVTLSGAEREFNLDPRTMAVSLEMSHAKPGWQEFVLTHDSLEKPAGLTVQEIKPQVILLRVHRLTEAMLPVRVPFKGELAPGLRLARVQVEPAEVRLLIPPAMLPRTSEVVTNPVNLGEVRKTKSTRLPMVLPEGAKFLHDGQAMVEVTIQVDGERDTPLARER